VSLLVGSVSINIPSEYKTFLGIPYAVNPQYENSLYEMMVLFVMGVIFLFLGIVMFLSSLYRTSIASSHRILIAKPSVSMEKKYCRYCGTENNKDAIFCEKCGRRISQRVD